MIYLGLGILGFMLLLLFDICSLFKRNIIKYFFAFSGFALIITSSFFIIQLNSQISFSYWVRIISLVISSLFLCLLIYSVFIEVGRNTYQYKNKNKLITTGTYALSRHPGVLWFLLVYLFGAIYFQNSFVLSAGIIWTVINIIYVSIQERFIFRRIFDDYGSYIKSTPMILPSSHSFEKCITTLNWRKR
ncbi:MAG: DUF1295 domain-containing protein [Candidatus Izimaplasma sp.]|nr:DUF1295 domain-containing protein [Candidatus Izimaplasma bacterium]